MSDADLDPVKIVAEMPGALLHDAWKTSAEAGCNEEVVEALEAFVNNIVGRFDAETATGLMFQFAVTASITAVITEALEQIDRLFARDDDANGSHILLAMSRATSFAVDEVKRRYGIDCEPTSECETETQDEYNEDVTLG